MTQPIANHTVPIDDASHGAARPPVTTDRQATADPSRGKHDRVHVLAQAFASSRQKVARRLAYEAAVASLSARNKPEGIKAARAVVGRVPANAKVEITKAFAERLQIQEERSARRVSADPLRISFRARVPALRTMRHRAWLDLMWEMYIESADAELQDTRASRALTVAEQQVTPSAPVEPASAPSSPSTNAEDVDVVLVLGNVAPSGEAAPNE
jgi:hypothetical protein